MSGQAPFRPARRSFSVGWGKGARGDATGEVSCTALSLKVAFQSVANSRQGIETLPQYYQTNVPTEPAGNEVVADLTLNFMLKVLLSEVSFNTISTFLPPGVTNATLGRPSARPEATLTEPGLTNLEA